MNDFTAQVHVTGSARQFEDDLPYLKAITDSVYASHAMVARDWLDAAASRHRQATDDSDVDWQSILESNVTAIRKSDLVIIEASQARFSQGYQAYLAAQYKKPVLVVTRNDIKGKFMSGVENKFITVKTYKSEDELRSIVTKFIKQNIIPDRDLRFNMILDRRIYKYLRDTSYETGKNKSRIVRELLERDMKRRQN